MLHRWVLRTGAALVVATALLGGLAGPAEAEKYKGKTVVVHFRDTSRRPITGTVVEEVEGKEFWLQIPNGRIKITVIDVLQIEVKKAPKEEFQDRFRAAKTAADYVALAKWCGLPEVKLPEERKRCLEEAIKIDPNQKEARKELGHVQDEAGQWIPEEDYYTKKGWVRVDGKWVAPEEAEKAREKAAKAQAEKSGVAKGLSSRELEDLGKPWAQAETLKSENYLLKCNSTPTVARRYQQVLEKLHDRYTEVLKDYAPNYTGLSTVFVFRNRDEFKTFTLSNAGGFFHPIDRSVRAYHGSFDLTGNTDQVLAHEATHQFQHRIMLEMNYVPLWVIEGMATYFGDGSKIEPGGVQLHVIPRGRLQTLQAAINTGHYVKLERLLKLRKGRDNEMPAYDHGWGVIFWCLQGDNAAYNRSAKGHKGEGKRVWKQYLDHVTKLQKPFPPNHFDLEAKFFMDLMAKETGKTIEQWETDYKQFILALPIEPVGKWSGRQWDGFNKVGVRFTAPEGFSPIKDQDLRVMHREAAAALTQDDVRLWLLADSRYDMPPDIALRAFVHSQFNDVEYDPDLKDEEYREEKISDVLPAIVTAFKGRYAVRREATVRVDVGGKAGKKSAGKTEKKAAAKTPDPTVGVRARVALLPTTDRFYFFCLSGPEAPFSKEETKFDDVLKSVRLNFGLR